MVSTPPQPEGLWAVPKTAKEWKQTEARLELKVGLPASVLRLESQESRTPFVGCSILLIAQSRIPYRADYRLLGYVSLPTREHGRPGELRRGLDLRLTNRICGGTGTPRRGA